MSQDLVPDSPTESHLRAKALKGLFILKTALSSLNFTILGNGSLEAKMARPHHCHVYLDVRCHGVFWRDPTRRKRWWGVRFFTSTGSTCTRTRTRLFTERPTNDPIRCIEMLLELESVSLVQTVYVTGI